ncbi:MAG TPA: L,D-transpeptidase, partial [Hyphomicrobiaceae bacterium]|nr:L,D-transpeptidase [Hyphomicrobiaceae bacterium]
MRRAGLKRVAGVFAGAAILALGTLPVAAQSWWGGGANSTYDRQVVSFAKTYSPGQVIVSFGDRRLYYISKRGEAVSYPIAVPRPRSRWQGTLRISMKKVDPSWTPTPSMRRENPKLPAFVPGGHPLNPLGNRALYLGSSLYRIHGTDAPWTIGKNVSKGCVRMHNTHVAELYNRVGVGTKVIATWKQYRVASASTGSGPSIDS